MERLNLPTQSGVVLHGAKEAVSRAIRWRLPSRACMAIFIPIRFITTSARR